MAPPIRSMAASLITPLEPGAASAARAAAAQVARQASHATAWCRIDAAVASACGSQHETNEDAHSALDGAGRLFVVADGVGGGAMAQLASGQLVAHLHAALDAERADAAQVRRAMLDADRAIARRIAQVTAAPGAATVALCAPVNVFASKWLVAWVGDCRVYRARLDGAPRIEALTRDDTFRHLGEAPPPGGSPDDPARMVGNGATAGANVAVHDLAAGDLLVLCSDGVHKWLDAEGWGRALGRAVPLAQRCNDVIALARRNGSVDDATVLLLQRSGFGLRRPRWGANDAHAADAAGSVR